MKNKPDYIERIIRETSNRLQVKDNKESLSIPLEERIHLIKDYETMPISRSYDNPLSLPSVNEGLIKTYPIEKTVSYIKKYFGFDDRQIRIEKNTGKILVNIPNIENNAKELEKKMKYCGYFLSYPSEDEIVKNKHRWMWFNFEPLHQEDNTREIMNNYSILFHLTPKYNIEKIKRFGLSPRSKNTFLRFPHRIYFIYPNFANEDLFEEEIFEIGQRLSDENKSVANNGEYCLVTVDLNKVGDNVRLYFDVNYEYGCFTTDYIKPEAIINIDYLNF